MNPDNLLIIAIVVFSLVLIGIVLTVLEFKHGAPKQQDLANEERSESPRKGV